MYQDYTIEDDIENEVFNEWLKKEQENALLDFEEFEKMSYAELISQLRDYNPYDKINCLAIWLFTEYRKLEKNYETLAKRYFELRGNKL